MYVREDRETSTLGYVIFGTQERRHRARGRTESEIAGWESERERVRKRGKGHRRREEEKREVRGFRTVVEKRARSDNAVNGKSEEWKFLEQKEIYRGKFAVNRCEGCDIFGKSIR